jgi:octaprenyl-diphosphate synthase
MDLASALEERHSEPRDSGGLAELRTGSASKLSLATLYEPIADELQKVESRLCHELQSKHESLTDLLRHGTQLGGKRLRPAMLLLSGQATGRLSEEHVILATVVEMVHTATLVHDDVIDQANLRRHVPTINAKWNEHTSILLGDFLFAQSFYLAATLPSTEACRWIGQAARLVCEGELRQVLQRDALDLDEATYVSLIRGKTAELCRVACQLGARFSGGSDAVVQALGAYGDAVGIAFQIADDYLDLWGTDETVGKTLGTDLVQGKMTLPLIRLLSQAAAGERAKIVQILRGPVEQRLSAIRPLLDNSDAKQHTRAVAESYRDQAIDSLAELESTPALEALRALARFSVDRRF